MPMYGWKPEFQIPRRKKKVWGPPPDISPHKSLKKGQLIKKKVPPQRRLPTEDELRILYEREVYRLFNLHASAEELQKQYEQIKNDKVYPGMIRAWLMNSYQGEADGTGMPQGQGTANMAGGVSYTGTFKQGLMHGPGLLKWGKGSSFEGDFYCNRLLGKGVYSWTGGAKYTGQIYDGLPHGTGTMEGEEGLKFEGSWGNGKREGQGIMTFGKVAVYEGNWKNDRKDGEGKLVFKTGSSYHGTWLEGKRHGSGHTQVQRIIPSSTKPRKAAAVYSHNQALKGMPDSVYAHNYTGDWMAGQTHGSGRSEWPWDGKKEDKTVLINSYVGSYEAGKRHGPGAFFYASGAMFKGHWRDNMKVGLGVLVYETGKLHFGVFSHDRYNPISNPGLDIKEPLETALQFAADDLQTAKYGVWRAVMRHKNAIQDSFTLYCSIVKEPPQKPPTLAPPLEEPVNPKRGGIGKADEKSPKKEKPGKQPDEKSPKKENPEKKPKEKPSKKDKKEEKGEGGKDKKGKPKAKEPPAEEIVEPVKKSVKIDEPDTLLSPRAIAGRARGMSNEQFWRLLRDGHFLQPGLGYAQVDRMLPCNDLSWDQFSDVHSNNRQLILREVVSALIQIGLWTYRKENISSEDKVERLFVSHLRLLDFADNGSMLAKVEFLLVQGVLNDNRSALDRLFCELLVESETPDYTIKLNALIQFGQSRRPDLDDPEGTMVARVALDVYGIQLKPGEEAELLNQDINYKEYEVILFIFATMGEELPELPEDDEAEARRLKKENEAALAKPVEDNATGKLQANEEDEKNLPKSLPGTDGKESKAKDAAKETGEKSPKSPKGPVEETKTKGKEKSPPTSPKAGKEAKTKGEETGKKNSPISPKGGKDKKSKEKKTKGKDTTEIDWASLSGEEKKEAKRKLREEYEIVVADLLKAFILNEVAVYKAPKVMKESKPVKGSAPNSPSKSGKKKK